ncbi:MAG: hypothetical protein J5925_03735 [Clostridia bacterium]|nr:hypothetical protein [Clostridia bacterium]MBR4799922.1 hypothetical protein [Clostridia bacterium]MBR5747057.1 hypothetical protein [Clostridia bacterium]
MTGQQLLESALDLCALRETDASIPADCADATQRAPALINLLLAENAKLDARVSGEEAEVHSITSLTDTVPACDLVAAGVLPYGLARLLLTGDDDYAAQKLGEMYETARANLLRNGHCESGSIEEVYP